ncbi:QsdR family transcriptional regulator [Microbacterium terregens]|uniref:QsdR family transcriptional regulator n=2 Tax=Microbacterium terregens TaxID=69363 RepID=A0ABV5SYG5_9MICO
MSGERIDMQDLARDLGVDRSTLFRWVGNRDTLLVSVLTSLTDPTLARIEASLDETGARRIARAAGAYAEALLSASYYRVFLRREPERALRLITTKESHLQQHVVNRFEKMITHERETGLLRHPLDAHDLAYLVVRVIESFVYSDLITGDEPNAEKVEAAIAVVVRVDSD